MITKLDQAKQQQVDDGCAPHIAETIDGIQLQINSLRQQLECIRVERDELAREIQIRDEYIGYMSNQLAAHEQSSQHAIESAL